VTRGERDLHVESLRASLLQARAAMTAKPCDATLRVVERLRGDLVVALNARSGEERRRADNARRRKERSG
jgi:hypothetical protein